MEEKKKEEKIGEALLKVALGYQVAEVTEEYAEVDGTLKLTKRKKTKKDVPPDLKAVQMLLAVDNGGGGMETLSDEELEAEKVRLLATLQKGTVEELKVTETATVKKTAVKRAATGAKAKGAARKTSTVKKKTVTKKTNKNEGK